MNGGHLLLIDCQAQRLNADNAGSVGYEHHLSAASEPELGISKLKDVQSAPSAALLNPQPSSPFFHPKLTA